MKGGGWGLFHLTSLCNPYLDFRVWLICTECLIMVMTDPDFSGIEWLDSLQGYLLTDFDF